MRSLATNTHAAAKADPANTIAALCIMLEEMLPYEPVTIHGVASRLRISVRTLQRRLSHLGSSFGEIIDDIRRAEAIRRVTAGENTAMEIALMLGYSDQAHFTRAFKRWTGRSPRQFEKSMSGYAPRRSTLDA